MILNKLYSGEALEVLQTFPDKSLHCCVTSPPYWGLRDYDTGVWVGGDEDCEHFIKGDDVNAGKKQATSKGSLRKARGICPKCGAVRVDKQLGMERTPEEYVDRLVRIMREVRRVLRDDGTLWLNLGDTYYGAKGKSSQAYSTSMVGKRDTLNDKQHQITGYGETRPQDSKLKKLKPKDLVGIPWMVAFALRADGWYLRQDIIWNKPNPMPESVVDRCTKAHEYIFLLSKSKKYYYDNEAIKTQLAEGSYERSLRGVSEDNKWATGAPASTAHAMSRPRKNVRFGGQKGVNYEPTQGDPNFRNGSHQSSREYIPSKDGMANKKSVWTGSTKPFKEAHFAVFPEGLIVDCIKAGCPEGGVVLDPFNGSGTTALVTRKLHRYYIGIDLNPLFNDMANKRLRDHLGLFV